MTQFSDTKLNYQLFDIAGRIEDIDRQIHALQFEREGLVERQRQIKKAIECERLNQNPNNALLAQKMSMDLLNEHLKGTIHGRTF